MPALSRSSGKWDVDHTLDDIYGVMGDTEAAEKLGDKTPVLDVSDQLETAEEKKARKRSHLVMYMTMFVMSIGFSIVLSGVWPYLKNLTDNTMEKSALGWVVAANPFGQMIASPLLGLWGNKAGSIRGACIISVVFFIGGNIMYAILTVFKDMGKEFVYYMMIVARFIVGVSSANVTLCRSYVAGSTTLKERTTGITVVAAAQALGFVVGPGIQALLTVLIPKPIEMGIPGLQLDEYTAAGWIAALLGFINLIIVMPCVFKEFNIAEKERAVMKSGSDNMRLPKPDYVAITGILFAFFFVLFIYVLLETLAEPFVTDQYAVNDNFAMVAVGIALVGGGLISIFMFMATSKLSRKYDERKILILMGMIPTIVGTVLYMPLGNAQITMQHCYNYTANTSTTPPPSHSNWAMAWSAGDNGDAQDGRQNYDFFYSSLLQDENTDGKNCSLGCPQVQEWCNDIPQLSVVQLLFAFTITIIGYPVAQSLCQSLFSKMLGPKPQGLWMGVLTGVGSLSRICGPVFVSYVYTLFGTYWTFGILSSGMFLALIELLVLFKRLVPMKIPTVKRGHDNRIVEDVL